MKRIKIESLYGYGTTDMSGEWTSTGGGYMDYRRSKYGGKFNYYISMRPMCKKWTGYFGIQMVSSNVCDLTLGQFSANTKKELKTMIENAILDFDNNPDLSEINNFIKNRIHHVFVDDVDGGVRYIGASVVGIRVEKEMISCSKWINDELSDCFRGTIDAIDLGKSTYYELSKDGSWRLSFNYGGYSGTSIPADIKDLCLSKLKSFGL